MGCSICPLRLYNRNKWFVKGVGNPNYGNMIIVHSVGKTAHKKHDFMFEDAINVLNKYCIEETGQTVTDLCYITPFIKCHVPKNITLDEQIINNCRIYMSQELIKFNPKNVLLLGSELVCSVLQDSVRIGNVIVTSDGNSITTNYAPGIIYHDQDKTNQFEIGIKKWFNKITN